MVGGHLDACPYDAVPGSAYCYFHEKVAAGLITTLDVVKRPDPSGGTVSETRTPSWRPPTPAKEVGRDPFEILLEEFDLLDDPVLERPVGPR